MGSVHPELLRGNESVIAFFLILKANTGKVEDSIDNLVTRVLEIHSLVSENVVVDWIRNTDIQNKIKNLVEDYILDVKLKYKLSIDFV